MREGITTIRCAHKFHRKCLEKWLETQDTCPLCRAIATRRLLSLHFNGQDILLTDDKLEALRNSLLLAAKFHGCAPSALRMKTFSHDGRVFGEFSPGVSGGILRAMMGV